MQAKSKVISRIRPWLIPILAFVLATPAPADIIELPGGQKVSGTFTRQGDNLIIKTENFVYLADYPGFYHPHIDL